MSFRTARSAWYVIPVSIVGWQLVGEFVHLRTATRRRASSEYRVEGETMRANILYSLCSKKYRATRQHDLTLTRCVRNGNEFGRIDVGTIILTLARRRAMMSHSCWLNIFLTGQSCEPSARMRMETLPLFLFTSIVSTLPSRVTWCLIVDIRG